jgi:hypothetical protein
MRNPQENPTLENPFQGINAEPFLAFFRNEDNYNTLLQALMLVEQALFMPIPPFEGEHMQAEYNKVMHFLNEKKLTKEYLEFRKELPEFYGV